MQIFHHFTNSYSGFSKGAFKSLNLADYVGDDGTCVRQNIDFIKNKFDLKQICFMKQIHSDKINIVHDAKMLHECDAIITTKFDLALCVLSADCIPLLLADEKNGVIAAVHAGRNGVFKNIATKCISLMKKDFNANQITAFVGNCIHQCCYEVDGEILQFAQKNYPNFVKNSHLDIHGILLSQLKAQNINIINESRCSCCHKEFFSYRRSNTTGRNAGLIMMRSNNA